MLVQIRLHVEPHAIHHLAPYVIVKTVVLVGFYRIHKTGCSGETRLVLHVPSL